MKTKTDKVTLTAIENIIANLSDADKKKVYADLGVKYEKVEYPRFSTWTSERSGKKFATVQFSSSGKGIMLNVEQLNMLAENWDKLVEYVEQNDID
jgi:hypothetical protein